MRMSGFFAVNNSVEMVKVATFYQNSLYADKPWLFINKILEKTPFVMQKAEKGEPLKKLA